MAVNETELQNSLGQYGNIVILGVNNEKSFIVVLDEVNADAVTVLSVIDPYLLADYPIKGDSTLVDGVFKTIYLKP